MAHVDYPYRFDLQGRTASTDYDEHIRDMIEQVLFTAPGERVNRPTFGSGLRQLLFAPNSDPLASTTQMLVQTALLEWLGDVIQVEVVEVSNDDSRLVVTVQYIVLQTRKRRRAQFAQSGAGA